MATLIEQEKLVEAKRGELGRLFEQNLKDGKYDFTDDQLTEVRNRTDEVNAEQKRLEDLRAADVAMKENQRQFEEMKRLAAPPMPNGSPADLNPMGSSRHMVENAYKSFADLVVESKAITEYRGGVGPTVDLEGFSLKAHFDARKAALGFRRELKTISTTSGWAPEVLRSGRLVGYAQEMPVVADLIPTVRTTSAAIKYVEQTTYTNLAAEVAEGGQKPESDFRWTERTVVVNKFAHWVTVTKEQLDDVPMVRDEIDNNLTLGLEQRLDQEILNGNGTPPNMAGIMNATAYPNVLTQAKGTDPVPDAIFKAMTQIRVTGKATPTGIVMHPNDWSDIRLLRTVDGVYIWGNPSDIGQDRIFGLPVVQTASCPEGTAVVGAWSPYSELALREGITIQASNSHLDYFTKNLIAIVAEMRAAFLVLRQTAFCKVTGI